ncbi:DUF1702 family protein [Kineosporia sp. NBRC 101731]|uniref:DUF1702 family protein n=1 Tax=Kineosporia sp. NBRC 101731 TaxID=3032199 RepID=UPI0025556573|nr:DUF1702 family protein [Kineosporia sp. NBRC 101731]
MTGCVRAWMLTPGPDAVRFTTRGFTATDPAARRRLEVVGETFLAGLDRGLAARDLTGLIPVLEGIGTDRRGFAFEGAAMGLALGDALTPWNRNLFGRFQAGPGERHVYMAYVGAGWAMARLPRFRWRNITLRDPVLRWLALDGFGFHETYFRTATVLQRRGGRLVRPPWPDPTGYARRALDQGTGRALWFVRGADVRAVAAEIGRFPVDRHADLWAGTGLAATYAGGAGVSDLRILAGLSGEYRPDLAQGAAFAAKARLRAGLVQPETVDAVGVLAGSGLAVAAGLTDEALVGLGGDEPGAPAFEVWRRRIRQDLARVVS